MASPKKMKNPFTFSIALAIKCPICPFVQKKQKNKKTKCPVCEPFDNSGGTPESTRTNRYSYSGNNT